MTTSGALIREARLRAGLTQADLAERSGKDRTQIARWERDAVQPSFETLMELVRACGYDLPLDLVPYERDAAVELDRTSMLTPQQRLDRALEIYPEPGDPHAIVQALERGRVNFVVIGGLARVLHGTDEPIGGVDVCPSSDRENAARLVTALDELGARPIEAGARIDVDSLSAANRVPLETPHGSLTIVVHPEGTREGYRDLRWHATREALGRGLRASIASPDDCARMLAALGREADQPRIGQLRRLIELERSHGIER